MSKTVRMGIVGCGVIGPKHAQIIKDIPGADLVAVADIVRERADAMAKRFDCQPQYSLDELLQREDIDCVSVCTPSGMHADMAIAAMEAKKHVIVEKPLDITLEAIDRMIATAKSTGMVLAGIFNYRFNTASIKLKKAVEQGELGRLTLGDAYVKWYRSKEYYESGDWRGTWELDGGGALMNQSVHFIDLLQWIMGPVESLSANVATLAHTGIDVEDVSTATLRFKSGALGVIEGSTAIVPSCPGKLEIHGTKGTVVLEENRITRWDIPGDEKPETGKEAEKGASDDPGSLGLEGHAAEIAHIIECIQTGSNPLVGGPQARHAVEIILAIYQSAKEKREIRLG